jgi:hypothetical protein
MWHGLGQSSKTWELPQFVRTSFDTVTGIPVPMSDFMALIMVPTQDARRGRLEIARVWRNTVNRHGGQVTLVHLPQVGIRRKTHFAFSDSKNVDLAGHVSKFVAARGLDCRIKSMLLPGPGQRCPIVVQVA